MKRFEQLIHAIRIGVIAMATVTSPTLSSTPAAIENNDPAIRPFRVTIPEKQLAGLRRKIADTRWPTKELVGDRSQGVQLATLQALAHYWATDYDWRKAEAKLNALPQFVTKIDGVDIHFIHVKSRHENAMPLIMTHGWPGSVLELLDAVAPLTDPTKHGGTAADAFQQVGGRAKLGGHCRTAQERVIHRQHTDAGGIRGESALQSHFFFSPCFCTQPNDWFGVGPTHM